MLARTRQQFVQAWQDQFKTFESLAAQAATGKTLELEIARFNGVRYVMNEMIERAADKAFPGYGILPS